MDQGIAYQLYSSASGPWVEQNALSMGLANGISHADFQDMLSQARDIAVASAVKRHPGSPANYMGIVALNHLRRLRKEISRRQEREMTTPPADLIGASDADPAQVFARRQFEVGLDAALRRLSPEQWETVAWVYGEGKRLCDLADEIGIPDSTASDRHVKGLAAICAALVDQADSDPLLAEAIMERFGEGALETLRARAARVGRRDK
jgi:hypothetical protein